MGKVPGGIRATGELDAVSTCVNERVLFEKFSFEIPEAGNRRTVDLGASGMEFEGQARGMSATGTPARGSSVPLLSLTP